MSDSRAVPPGDLSIELLAGLRALKRAPYRVTLRSFANRITIVHAQVVRPKAAPCMPAYVMDGDQPRERASDIMNALTDRRPSPSGCQDNARHFDILWLVVTPVLTIGDAASGYVF